jgi:hypothetical protein
MMNKQKVVASAMLATLAGFPLAAHSGEDFGASTGDSGLLDMGETGTFTFTLVVGGTLTEADFLSEFSDGKFSTGEGSDKDKAKDKAIVPIPAAAWLLGSGLIGLVAIARRKVVVAWNTGGLQPIKKKKSKEKQELLIGQHEGESSRLRAFCYIAFAVV